MVSNLVVEIEIFNFCLFVCTSHFANFARGKWSNHDSENCSDVVSNLPVDIAIYNFDHGAHEEVGGCR